MKRETKEVNILVEIDKKGKIETQDKVLNHLLKTLFFYMGKDVNIEGSSDLKHHLWEDMGITLGEEIKNKIKDKKIKRFGSAIMPMDDALVVVSVDISRPYLSFDTSWEEDEEGFEKSLIREFLWALARTLGATIHIKKLSGINAHHLVEASFKGLGKALSEATKASGKTLSTKGTLS